MEKDKFPSTDNLRLFGFNLNERYRFYVFTIALFGLPIGLFRTSQYMMYLRYIIESITSGSLSPSQFFEILFQYSSLIGLSVLSQLILTILSLYVLIKIYVYQKKIIHSNEKQILWAFRLDDEKKFILLVISLFGIIMYSFHILYWVNNFFYTIQGLSLDHYLTIASVPQIVFNLITCSMVIIVSIYNLVKLHNFQNAEEKSPKIFSFTYHEKYVKLIFILALIGIFASMIIYILMYLAYIPIYLYSLIQYGGTSFPEELILYYSNYIRQSLIEIGRGVIILVLSILTIKKVHSSQKQLRE